MAKVLPTAEKELISQLLAAQANEFFRGAEALYTTQGIHAGDSAYFLRLMAIELYFKLLYLRDTEALIFGHDLREIFDVMPSAARDVLFASFNKNLKAPLQLKVFREWLKYLGNLFVQIRYPFEEFREMSQEEYEAKVRRFEQAADDDLSEASIIYHMPRVEALLAAVRESTGTVWDAHP